MGSMPDDESNNIYVENDNIAIKIVGGLNVPMYSFWDPSQDATKYDVKFILLFEIIDVDTNGLYDPEVDTQVPLSTLALPAMSWVFSEIVISEDNTTHFNITSQGAAFTIQFANHFGTDASLKYDIIIDDYEFVSDSEDVMLVLGFHLLEGEFEEGDEVEAEQSGDRIDFGENAYFEAESTATASGETINVGLTMGSDEGGEPLAYVAFERFDGNLVHDPTIGIESGDGQFIPGPNVSLLVTIFVITNILVINRYKRKNK